MFVDSRGSALGPLCYFSSSTSSSSMISSIYLLQRFSNLLSSSYLSLKLQSWRFSLATTCLLDISTRSPQNFSLPCLKPNSKLLFFLCTSSDIPYFIHLPIAKIPVFQRSLETSQQFLGHSHITILAFSIKNWLETVSKGTWYNKAADFPVPQSNLYKL